VAYWITWRPRARRNFLALDPAVRKRVDEAIGNLGKDPRPAGVKALTGMPGTLRVRVGDYRVLYTISDSDQRIRIIDVRHRSKAYGDR
jgi:mRNA interferase RelE/StbE